MKKLSRLSMLAIIVILISCGSDGNKSPRTNEKATTKVDSLKEDLNNDHNVGMAKMGRLTRAEQATQRKLDSIAKLPAKARQAAEPLRVKLDSLQKDLEYAEFAMNKWMEEFKWDSAFSSVKEEVEYLSSEKLKVSKVKESILSGIEKADSVLKRHF